MNVKNSSSNALCYRLVLMLTLVLSLGVGAATAKEPVAGQSPVWPPAIPAADSNGVIELTGEGFVNTPEYVKKAMAEVGFDFVVAETPPTVELVYHDELPNQGVRPGNSTGWTSWGDVGVGSDGAVYSAIGDHGIDGTRLREGQTSDAHVLVYRWLPEQHKLEQIVNPNVVVNAGPSDPNWSKVHAAIHEGADGKVYFVPTFNDGQRAAEAKWTKNVPTGQIFQYDPATGKSQVIGLLPPKSATATSELDRERNILYINLEGIHRNALFAFDLASREVIFQGPDAMIGQNRNMAIGNDGSIYFNAADGMIGRYDPQKKEISSTGIQIPNGAALRSSTRQASDGWIYGSTYGGKGGGKLIRFNPQQKKVEVLGPDFLSISNRGAVGLGNYTTVSMLSPDEKYVYYLPGAHGGAVRVGCPVVQYEIATGKHKVLAFLRPVMEEQAGYVPGGTYGAKLSADGSTLYVNFNGHAIEKNRLEGMKDNGFGLTAFAAIHIPASER